MQLNEQPRPNLLVCPGFRFSPGKTKENIPVRNLPLITDAALLGLCFGRIAAAGDIRVIANPSVSASAVSVDELKSVFLSTKTSLSDGSHVEPVLGGSAHTAFLKEYLGKTDAALPTYYRCLVFTGKGSMPKSLGSDAEVVAFVAKTRGAVGYVGSSANTVGVKILEVK